MNEKVIIEKIMIISTCSSPIQEQVAMGMRPNTTPLLEIYSDLWREVFCQFSETESVRQLVPYVPSILYVYVSVYRTFLSKPISVNF